MTSDNSDEGTEAFVDESKETHQRPKTTRVKFLNPEHPDVDIYERAYSPEGTKEKMKRHWDGAKWVQSRLGPDRTNLYGEFAYACAMLETEENESYMINLMKRLGIEGIEDFKDELSQSE